MHLPFDLAAGLFTGALTNTPALAAATDVVERIAPGQTRQRRRRLWRRLSLQHAERRAAGAVPAPPAAAQPGRGRGTLARRSKQRIARPAGQEVSRSPTPTASASGSARSTTTASARPTSRASAAATASSPPRRDIMLQPGDVVMVVGPADELDKMACCWAKRPMCAWTSTPACPASTSRSPRAPSTGQDLAQLKVWERYGVVITRIRREGLEIAPSRHREPWISATASALSASGRRSTTSPAGTR